MDSNEHTIPEKSLGGKRLSFETLRYVSENAARNHRFLPLGVVDGVLEIGMEDPSDFEAKDIIQFIASTAGLPLKIYKISTEDYEEGLKSYEGLGGEVDQALDEFETERGDLGEAELIETKKDEKKYFTPSKRKMGERGYIMNVHSDVYEALNNHLEKDRRIKINIGSFSCQFPLRSIIEIKTLMEKELPEIKQRFWIVEKDGLL